MIGYDADALPSSGRFALHAQSDHLVLRIGCEGRGEVSELAREVLVDEEEFHAGKGRSGGANNNDRSSAPPLPREMLGGQGAQLILR